jgi:glucose-1-phosphate adenylyltransferase
MDYGPMLAAHVQNQADMTVSCLEVPLAEAAGTLGVMTVDDDGRVIRFDEKPAEPTPIPGRPDRCLASMGNYVFNTKFLYEQVIRDADDPRSQHDFGRNLIPDLIRRYRVFAYPFRDEETGAQAYWRDVGTLDAFWQANMELVSVTPELNLYDEVWPIFTHATQAPPAKFIFDRDDRRGVAVDSMVSSGCIVSGSKVERSLLFSNVKVHSYATVADSVVLPAVEIGRRCRVRHAIVDRGAHLPAGMVIGEDPVADAARGFRVTERGIVLVTPDMLGQPLHFTR